MAAAGDANSWGTVLASVESLGSLVAACLEAWEDDGGAKVSATTRKRLAGRALAGLRSGRELVQAARAQLLELQRASQQLQAGAADASASHRELQQALDANAAALQDSKRGLLRADAERLAAAAAQQEARQQLSAAETDKAQLADTISSLTDELQAATARAAAAHARLSELQAQVEQLATAAAGAEAGADAAAAALASARQQLASETAARQRHEDAVARLTADNLLFMAQRDEAQLALRAHAPRLDELHQMVEQRVKQALARAEQLEAERDAAASQHAQQLAQLQQQLGDAQAELQRAQQQADALAAQARAADAAAAEARAAAAAASAQAADAQAVADARAAELRVAQDSMRSMREECNERWMSERAACGQLAGLQAQAAEQEERMAQVQQALDDKAGELATQRAVNQQLMLKKEEVEWQLLAAIAQASQASGTASPLSPQARQSMQQQQQLARGADPSNSASSGQPAGAGAAVQPGSLFEPPAASGGSGASCGPVAAAVVAAAAALAPEEPGPASFAAGGGLWQLPHSNSLSADGAGALHRPSAFLSAALAAAATSSGMPAAPAAGGALPCSKDGQPGSAAMLEHDLFNLPSLSFGLATLPSPEQMFAAAAAASSGPALASAASLGRAGSLSAGGGSGAVASPAGSGGVLAGLAAASGAGDAAAGAAAGRAAAPKAVVVGPTGGLMAPYSPLRHALAAAAPQPQASSLPVSMGAVFPSCITASAVSDADAAAELAHGGALASFSFPPSCASDAARHAAAAHASGSLFQALGPGFWYQQGQATPQGPAAEAAGHGRQRDSRGAGGRHHGSGSSLCSSTSSLGAGPHTTSSPDGSSSSREHAAGRGSARLQPGRRHTKARAEAPASEAAAAAAAAVAGPRPTGAAGTGGADVAGSSGSGGSASSGQLHSILLNGPNSRPRSPGLSPSGSLKSVRSVRFSFESLHGASDGDGEQLQDQRGAAGGAPGVQRSKSGGSGSPLHAGSGRAVRGVQQHGHSRLAAEHGGHHGHHGSHGSHTLHRGRASQQQLYQQQLYQQQLHLQRVRQQQAAKAAAAVAALAGKPPVHPVFGAMGSSGGGGGGH